MPRRVEVGSRRTATDSGDEASLGQGMHGQKALSQLEPFVKAVCD
jgi:hypothetical protein